MLRSHINATTLQQHLMKKLDYIKWDKLRNNNFLSISVSVQSFVFNVSQITFTNRWFCIDPMPNLKTCQVKVFRCILQLAAQLFIDTSWFLFLTKFLFDVEKIDILYLYLTENVYDLLSEWFVLVCVCTEWSKYNDTKLMWIG